MSLTLPTFRLPSVQTLLLLGLIGFVGYREYQGHVQPAPVPAPAPAYEPAAVAPGHAYRGLFLEAGAMTVDRIADGITSGQYDTPGKLIAAQRLLLRDQLKAAWQPSAALFAKQLGDNPDVTFTASQQAVAVRWYKGFARGMRNP